MSLEDNKALVQRFLCFLNSKEHVNALHEFVDTTCLLNGQPFSLVGLQDLVLMLRTAFPDEQLTVETLVAEGEYVAVRLRAHATHDGPWCSPVGVLAPTGLPVAHTGMQFVRIQGSRIVELWTEWNVLGQLQQLGAVPTPDFVAV